MSSNDEIKRIKEKLQKIEEPILILETSEHAAGENTKEIRESILWIAHYYHLLQNLGDGDSADDQSKLEEYLSLARIKIQKAREYEGKKKEIAELSLIDQHTRAWNMAEYYYEKGSKILCQMIITLMDYMLQEKGAPSILYRGKDKSSYFNLLDEITALNNDYLECFCFLCAYDFCTEKIADFTGIKEYRKLIREHERIITNGLPGKVADSIKQLEQIAGPAKSEYFIDLRKAFTPTPLYSIDMLSEAYQRGVSMIGDEVTAMTIFSSLVINVDQLYEGCIKE